ncbi:MAG: PIN domain-containing protein [Actinobacteria bacterium]|nr:PIN domain-containing protein [Actinomycetota bacterium]
MTTEYLLDNSAWARLRHPALPTARRDDIADAIADSRVYTCLPFLLEAGYSARNAEQYTEMMRHLRGFPFAATDDAAALRALALQGDLAACGHHRLPPPDLIIAAIAERHALTVLHCDKDFDVICKKTSAVISAEWLAPPDTFS